MAKKTTWWWLIVTLLVLALSLRVGAEEGTLPAMPEEFGAVGESLPEDVKERLPDGVLSDRGDEQAEGIQEMLSPRYWLSLLSEAAGKALGGGFAALSVLCGLLILVAVLRTVRSSIASEGLSRAVDFCSTGAIFAAVLHGLSGQLREVSTFFERLHALMLAMIPVGGTVLAMGGNVSTAATGTATLSFFLAFSESLCAGSILPVTATAVALILCRSLHPDSGLSGIQNAIRRVYTFSLGLMMSLMSLLLSAQTTLSASADSIGARTARLVSANVVPVVGGAVGDSLRTVASGVQYLKSVVGIGGIAFLCLLLLPVLLSLVTTRLVLLLGSGVAEMLGCDGESRLLSELAGVWGTMLAVVSMTSVMFLLALTVLVHVTVAAG